MMLRLSKGKHTRENIKDSKAILDPLLQAPLADRNAPHKTLYSIIMVKHKLTSKRNQCNRISVQVASLLDMQVFHPPAPACQEHPAVEIGSCLLVWVLLPDRSTASGSLL